MRHKNMYVYPDIDSSTNIFQTYSEKKILGLKSNAK